MRKKSETIENIGALHSYKCTFTLVMCWTIHHFDTNSCVPELDWTTTQKNHHVWKRFIKLMRCKPIVISKSRPIQVWNNQHRMPLQHSQKTASALDQKRSLNTNHADKIAFTYQTVLNHAEKDSIYISNSVRYNCP